VGLKPWLQDAVKAAREAAVSAPDDAEKIGRLGMLYLLAASPLDASICFRRATDLDPKVLRWKYYLALSHDESFETAAAEACLRQAIALDDTYPPLFLRLGDLLFKTRPAAAMPFYEKAVKLNPRDARSHYGLGECALAAGDRDAAMAHYRRAIEEVPAFADAHRALARLLAEEGRRVDAQAHELKAIDGGPAPIIGDPLFVELLNCSISTPGLVADAERLAKEGRVQDAIAMLQTAAAGGDRSPTIRNTLGILLGTQGRYEEAARHFLAVLDDYPDWTEVRSNLGLALQNLGKYEKAEQIFRQLLDKNPRDEQALGLFGMLMLETGRPHEALPSFRKARGIRPEKVEHGLGEAMVHVCLGDSTAAVGAWVGARKSAAEPDGPSFSLVFRLVKLMAAQVGAIDPARPGKGRVSLRDVVALESPLRAAGRSAPQEDSRSGGPATAKQASTAPAPLDEASALAREADRAARAAELLAEEAARLCNLGQFETALHILEPAVEDDPGGTVENAIGAVETLRGRPAAASDHFRKAQRLNPKSAIARSNLGQALAEQGQEAEAEKLLREVLADEPDHVPTLRRLGLLLGRLQRIEEGMSLLRRCEELAPGDRATRFSMADLLATSGKGSEALDLAHRAVDAADPDARLLLGNLLQRLGDPAAAEKEWREAIRLRPAFVSAYLALEAAARERDDYAAAVETLQNGLTQAPESALLANNLAFLLSTCPTARLRNPELGVKLAEKACQLTDQSNFQMLDTLAITYASVGRFDEAVATQRRALELAGRAAIGDRLNEFRQRLALFESGRPYFASRARGN
jgi:tetratricopeptide (TPR) repeat protein